MGRLEDLETFVCVAKTGSVRGAADQLERAPSAVSRRIKELESRLRVQLLNRTTRQVTLTSAGERFLARAQQILADLEEAEEGAAADSEVIIGRLRITMPLSFGIAHLVPAINDFMHENPAVTIDADFSDHTVDIVGDRFDLALRIGKLNDSQLRARQLAPIHHVVAASPDFWREHRKPTKPDQLSGLPALCYSNLAHPTTWHWAKAQGQTGHVDVKPQYMASNGDALVSAAISGHGVVRLPTFLLNDAIVNGALQPVLMSYSWGSAGLYALYPDTVFLPNRTRRFIDYLIKRFGDHPEWDACLSAHLKSIGRAPEVFVPRH